MAEEIASDPESKTLGDGGPGAIQQPAKSSDGGDATGVGGDGGEERWKRERWTRNESMALVSAMKQLEEDASTTSTGGDAKWKSISQICSNHGVQRTSVQCRKRWNTLLAAYRKIKDWEKKNGMESYWAMGGLDCKAKKLPAGFDEEIWNVMNSFLAGRSGMSPRLFSYKTEDPTVEPVTAGALQIDLVPMSQSISQPLTQGLPEPLPESLPQSLPQSFGQSLPVSLLQPAVQSLPHTLPDPLLQPASQVLTQSVSQHSPQPANPRVRREGVTPRKRKRGLRQEIPVVLAQESPRLPKVDGQDAGTQRHGFEGLEPLTRFLPSFLEKSLEAYERNNDLDRKLRKEQGDKLVAVLGSLSSAVRDLVQQK
ncbi:unnamed protein product [Calypogeia fissa]